MKLTPREQDRLTLFTMGAREAIALSGDASLPPVGGAGGRGVEGGSD